MLCCVSLRLFTTKLNFVLWILRFVLQKLCPRPVRSKCQFINDRTNNLIGFNWTEWVTGRALTSKLLCKHVAYSIIYFLDCPFVLAATSTRQGMPCSCPRRESRSHLHPDRDRSCRRWSPPRTSLGTHSHSCQPTPATAVHTSARHTSACEQKDMTQSLDRSSDVTSRHQSNQPNRTNSRRWNHIHIYSSSAFIGT